MKNLIFFVLVVFTTFSFRSIELPLIHKKQIDITEVKCKVVQKEKASTPEKKPDFDFAYIVEPRFLSSISLDKLKYAKTILDIVPTRDGSILETYYNIELSTYNETSRKDELRAKGPDHVLTPAQIEILKSMDHRSDFYITGNFRKMDYSTGNVIHDTLAYYISIVPEFQANYRDGMNSLLKYLKDNSKKTIAVAEADKLDPGKISFTISKEGKIKDIVLSFSCGYKSIDSKMMELIKNIPGEWDPASNLKGEAVDQELVFFYGLVGC